jgi:hypothetical protein
VVTPNAARSYGSKTRTNRQTSGVCERTISNRYGGGGKMGELTEGEEPVESQHAVCAPSRQRSAARSVQNANHGVR